MQRYALSVSLLLVITTSLIAPAQTAKPKLTLDEFFNSVSFDAVRSFARRQLRRHRNRKA